jgi:hypothetical protein
MRLHIYDLLSTLFRQFFPSQSPMKIRFYGAAKTVTGSMRLATGDRVELGS